MLTLQEPTLEEKVLQGTNMDPVTLALIAGGAQTALSAAGSIFSINQNKRAASAQRRIFREQEARSIEQISNDFNTFIGSFRATLAAAGISSSSRSARATEASAGSQANRGVFNTRLQTLFNESALEAQTTGQLGSAIVNSITSGIAGGIQGLTLGMQLEQLGAVNEPVPTVI